MDQEKITKASSSAKKPSKRMTEGVFIGEHGEGHTNHTPAPTQPRPTYPTTASAHPPPSHTNQTSLTTKSNPSEHSPSSGFLKVSGLTLTGHGNDSVISVSSAGSIRSKTPEKRAKITAPASSPTTTARTKSHRVANSLRSKFESGFLDSETESSSTSGSSCLKPLALGSSPADASSSHSIPFLTTPSTSSKTGGGPALSSGATTSASLGVSPRFERFSNTMDSHLLKSPNFLSDFIQTRSITEELNKQSARATRVSACRRLNLDAKPEGTLDSPGYTTPSAPSNRARLSASYLRKANEVCPARPSITKRPEASRKTSSPCATSMPSIKTKLVPQANTLLSDKLNSSQRCGSSSSLCSSGSLQHSMSTRSNVSKKTPSSDISSPLLRNSVGSFNFSPPASMGSSASGKFTLGGMPLLSPEPSHSSVASNSGGKKTTRQSGKASSSTLATRYQAYYRSSRRISCPLGGIEPFELQNTPHERPDIFMQLYRTNVIIAKRITEYLPGKCLREAAATSKAWFYIINSIPEAKLKIEDYLATIPDRTEDMQLDSFGVFRSPMRPTTRSHSLTGTSLQISPTTRNQPQRRFLRSPIINRQGPSSTHSRQQRPPKAAISRPQHSTPSESLLADKNNIPSTSSASRRPNPEGTQTSTAAQQQRRSAPLSRRSKKKFQNL